MRIPSYSVRTLLLVVLVVSTLLSRFSWNVHSNRTQRKAVEAIREMSGGVGFGEGQFLARPLSEREKSIAAQKTWFDDAVDKRTPNYVLFASVDDRAKKLGDGDVQQLISLLRQLRSVKLVELEDTAMTDEGVNQLRAALPHCSIRIRTLHGRRRI